MNARPLVGDMLAGWARRAPHKNAFVEDDRSLTWSELDDQVSRLAAGMAAHGVGRGDAVGMLAKDHYEQLVHIMACLRLGAVRVGINARYAAREILHVVRDADVRMVIVEDQLLELVADHADVLRAEGRVLVVLRCGALPPASPLPPGYRLTYQDLLGELPTELPVVGPQEVGMISYTSGTTGMPKGVLLSQGGLAATGVQVVTLMGLAPDDVWYQATSLAWSACQLALLGLVNGMTTVLPGGIGSFDISHFLHTIGRHHVSGTMLAPVMVRRVLDELDRGSYDLSSFRKITYGSSPAPPALVRRVREALPRVELMQLYGATEGGFVTVLTHTEHMRGFNGEEALLRSCGRPGGWVDMQVMDDEGRPVAPGETGEVWLRSPMNCLGYHGLPEQTEALLAGEWIRSHDIGWMDDEGFLYLTDRKNFMIITGGMNVYPNVVENVLATHPAVADVAVVGAEHPEWGEAVVAVVEPRPGVEAEPPELIAFCRERLGAFEVPKYVRIVDVLPRGVTGKILKPALIAEFVEHPDQLPWNRVQPPVVVGGGAVT